MEGKGENGIVEGSSDCEDERAKLRPADIDADVREMERRKRVEAMMSSRLFREELERIVEAQMKDGAAAVGPLLQQIQDMIQTGPARAHNSFSVKSTNCVIPINDIRGVESMGYAKGEKILRCKLAAVYRLMDLYGWTQGISNHITGRLNQEEELLLVNAYGMLFHEVTASSLVKVDMQGNIVEPGTTNYGVNVQGFHLHAAIHQARPDIKCIIHVHTPSVLAVSSLKVGLLPLSNESVVVGEVSFHHSTGSIQEPEEKDKLARNLGPINKVMLLSNNGAVCCGETVEEAFFNVYNTVLACESQMKVMPLGVDNLVLMQDEARKAIYDTAHRVPESTALPSTTGQPTENKEKRWRIGGLHFEALMRMLDNAGFRTGYIYRTPLIKGEPPKPRSDVEVPPAVSSLGYLLEEEEMYRNWKKMGGTKNDRTRWLNSPNVYQKVEILETGTPDPKKITKWVADGSPTHSSTPVKIADALQFVPKNTNPKEFKKLQQQIKENRRADKITSGPQSHILEGVTWEEAKKLQDANLIGAGDQVVLVGAASKGIIQREFQHNATVYKTPYAKNPFDCISTQEIEEYKRTVTRKQRGESYDEDQSESEALSSSAALPPSGLKSPPSETDEDSRTEPRVLRIETKTAPIPIQAEYVLSDDDVFLSSPEETRKTLVTVKVQEVVDNKNSRKIKSEINSVSEDCPRKLGTSERIRCFTRFALTPSPACKEHPLIVDLSSFLRSAKLVKYSNEKHCSLCKSSFGLKRHSDFWNRSTQTILSINEVTEENLCCIAKSVLRTSASQTEKRPVVRKLVMDSVIDELKDKFRVNRFEKLDFINLDQYNHLNSSEDESTSCSIYHIPDFVRNRQSFTGNDFTSEETITHTGSSSLTEESPKENCETGSSGEIESYIGNDFEGCESMTDKLSPLENFNENLDSFLLSDLLSNFHLNDDRDSSVNSNLYVTHHTNKTKKAVLMKNNFINQTNQPDLGYSVVLITDESFDNQLCNVNITDKDRSTNCTVNQIEEKPTRDKSNRVESVVTDKHTVNLIEDEIISIQKIYRNVSNSTDQNNDTKHANDFSAIRNQCCLNLNPLNEINLNDTHLKHEIQPLTEDCRNQQVTNIIQTDNVKDQLLISDGNIYQGYEIQFETENREIGNQIQNKSNENLRLSKEMKNNSCDNREEVTVDIYDIEHLRSENESIKFRCEKENQLENVKYSVCESLDQKQDKTCFNSGHLLNANCSDECSAEKDENTHLSLMVDGKELYNFYKDFDPNEVFQSDADNLSMQAHYDNQSLTECHVDEDILSALLEEDVEYFPLSNDSPVLVNENIFTGKKYLMNRYLSGNEDKNSVDLNDSVMIVESKCSSYRSDGSVGSKSENDNCGEICCGVSEDSAVFSVLTVKANAKVMDPDKVVEWSLSENSKEGFSVNSSGSSGIRMSSTSDDDVPDRPTISSIEEFLIKETVCNICPGLDKNSLYNSRLTYPISFSQSCLNSSECLKRTRSLPNVFVGDSYGLLSSVKTQLNFNSFKMPNKSTICSYYTLVSGVEKCLSLPDLSYFAKKFRRNDSVTSSQTNSSSDSVIKDEFDDHDVYISDDYICHDSGSEFSDSTNVLYFLNDSNNVNCVPDKERLDNHEPTNITSSNESDSMNYGTNLISRTVTEIKRNNNFTGNGLNISYGKGFDSNSLPSIRKNVTFIKDSACLRDSNCYSVKTDITKDCLVCFTISMEESIDHLLPNKNSRNRIICSLKKRFSRHKCSSSDLKRPMKSSLHQRCRSHKTFGRRSCFKDKFKTAVNHSKNLSTSPELCNSLKFDVESDETDKGEPFDVSSSFYYSCNSCVSYSDGENAFFSKIDNIPDKSNPDTVSMWDRREVYAEESVLPHFFTLDCEDYGENDFVVLNEDTFSSVSSKEQMIISSRSESYFSIPTSSISSDNETFLSLGNCEPSVESARSCFDYNTNNKEFKTSNTFLPYVCRETSTDPSQMDHNIAFTVNVADIQEGSSVETVSSDEDIDNYLHEIAVNVSSVSCQTDESFQDDISEYHPEDYREITDQYGNSNVCNANNMPDSYLTLQNSSNQLYTIYETSYELSPEY